MMVLTQQGLLGIPAGQRGVMAGLGYDEGEGEEEGGVIQSKALMEAERERERVVGQGRG